jgi:drug/metabolite transporter (DMT)-like permease
MKRDRALAYAAFAVVCIVWGTTYLAIRVAVRTIPPFLLTGARFVIAGLILFAFARIRGDAIPRGKRLIAELLFVGLLMVGVGNLSVVWAEQWVPSGFAALLVATAPFWAALLEWFRRDGDRIDARRGIGMLAGFIGVALLVTPGGAGGAFDLHFVVGALAIQIGSFAWQYGTVRGKYNLAMVPPLMSSAFQMLTGGIAVTIVGLASGEAQRLTITPKGIAALAYLTIFGSVLAYTSYVYALKKIRVTSMSLYAYINPLVAVLLGWLILDEHLTWISVIAMCVILGGVALVQSGGRRSYRTVEIPGSAAAEETAA